jgi:hypothetical protein
VNQTKGQTSEGNKPDEIGGAESQPSDPEKDAKI